MEVSVNVSDFFRRQTWPPILRIFPLRSYSDVVSPASYTTRIPDGVSDPIAAVLQCSGVTIFQGDYSTPLDVLKVPVAHLFLDRIIFL